MELIERPLLVPKVLDSNLTHLLPYPDSTRLPENEMLGAPLVWIYSRSEAGLKKVTLCTTIQYSGGDIRLKCRVRYGHLLLRTNDV